MTILCPVALLLRMFPSGEPHFTADSQVQVRRYNVHALQCSYIYFQDTLCVARNFIRVPFLTQQLRKLVLELIHRLPANDYLKGHVKVQSVQLAHLHTAVLGTSNSVEGLKDYTFKY